MSYYMGDFYRGDFYRGDPGFFGSLFGGIKRIAGAVLPGPAGALVRAIPGGGSGTLAARGASAAARVAGQAAAAVRGHPVLSAAGAAGVIGGALGRRTSPYQEPLTPIGSMPYSRGYHVSRKTGKVVKNRHMRVTNVKALRRSLRRIHGFSRIARKVIHIAHPPKGTRVRFKFRRKKRA
jgi:hypothetical protein